MCCSLSKTPMSFHAFLCVQIIHMSKSSLKPFFDNLSHVSFNFHVVFVRSLSCVWVFAAPWTCIPGFAVLHCLPEFAQIHVHWVSDAVYLIVCHSLLLLPSVFSSESALHNRIGQRIGASALASVLIMNIQDWFPLGLTG